MILTLSLVAQLALAQKVEIIRGGAGKKKRPVATAVAEPGKDEAREKALDEKSKSLEAREQELSAKEKALDEKSKDQDKKNEEEKKKKEDEKKAAEATKRSVDKMAADNAAAINDISRALGN
jgi:hypothetical protein